MRQETRKVQGSRPAGRQEVQVSKAGTVPIPSSDFCQKLSSPKSEIRNPKSIRLGLFGGAFNPIHFGHLRAAMEIQEAFSLNQVLFIPTAVPPHKEIQNLLPFTH